jgi:hypothetical protein
MMIQSLRETRSKAYNFTNEYKDTIKESAESQSFLNDFFNIFGIHRRRVATFERPVRTDSRGVKSIDLLWEGVLLVEMKSTGQDLDKAYKQGKNYFKGLNDKQLPRFVLVCDFNEFRLYDLDNNQDYRFELDDLVKNLHLFDFMNGGDVGEITEYDLNEKAALLLGKLHDSLEKSNFAGHQLQVFMVRILFCLFAEDTGVFNRHQFVKYLQNFTNESGLDTEMHLSKLFQILNKSNHDRNTNLSDELNAFPYVNGDLFKERIDMPSFTSSMREQLLECCYFNWHDISPAIFGSLFQSIMDKDSRRNLGAHYTSETNILKLIKPLFLNDLENELNQIIRLKQKNTRNRKLVDLMKKIQSLTFLDPACGCGNFLIITYREIRRLELQILKAQQKDSEQIHISIDIDPQINLNNFYGIEIDEWPTRIAEVAMWLTQHQMNVEFAKAFGREPDLLPLKERANIHNGNALEVDWAAVVEKDKLNYIIGNPPFVGNNFRTKEQRQLQISIFGKIKNAKQLDFVSNWFYKSAQFIQNTNIDCGFVSTNSITNGEQVATLWTPILEMGISLHFAHRSFAWHNDAKGKAAVHCVIIGFGQQQRDKKYLFDYATLKSKPNKLTVKNINPYLINIPNIVISSRNQSLSFVSKMLKGSEPTDGGFLLLNFDEQKQLLQNNPELNKWIKPVLGAREFLNNKKRYCLWLVDIGARELKELMKIPEIKRRIEGVKQMRLASNAKGTRKKSATPWLFGHISQKESDYILVPRVSSERREYVPMGFFDKKTICSDANLMIPNATLYEFAILTSQIHMDWMRVVAGRLKSDYRYSATLVYNNFPFPKISDKKPIEKLAQAILDAREIEFKKDPQTSLADLYDPDIMPPTLRKAHKKLDKAIDKLYQKEGFKNPLERVKHLFKLYQKLQE